MHLCSRLFLLAQLLLWIPAFAADMAGASDPTGMQRVTDSVIIGFERSDYDSGSLFVLGENDQVVINRPEGKRHRVLYLAAEGDSPLKIQRNYETAVQELGEVEETYACLEKECNAHLFATTLWTRDTMVETNNVKQPFYLLGFAHVFTSPSYRSFVVTSANARYHIGVLSAVLAANNSNTELRGRTVTLVEVVEDADFVPSLVFVDAATMQREIDEKGRVALYGIQFEHDSATLSSDSLATLEEIKSYLLSNRTIRIYVVGHTDDAGALAYNQSLAERRAQSVVNHLVANGIEENRLQALGVGPAAPVASNDTESGRAENRRVELVKRLE